MHNCSSMEERLPTSSTCSFLCSPFHNSLELTMLENTQVTSHMVFLLGDSASALPFVLTKTIPCNPLLTNSSYSLASSLAPPLRLSQVFLSPPTHTFLQTHQQLIACRHQVEEEERMGGSSAIPSSFAPWSDRLFVDHFSAPQRLPPA